MKKKLLSLALVLVMAAAIALPVGAAPVSIPFAGVTVTIDLGFNRSLAAASTDLSTNGDYVETSLQCQIAPTSSGIGGVITTPVWGGVGSRSSYVTYTPPVGQVIVRPHSMHYVRVNGQANSWSR